MAKMTVDTCCMPFSSYFWIQVSYVIIGLMCYDVILYAAKFVYRKHMKRDGEVDIKILQEAANFANLSEEEVQGVASIILLLSSMPQKQREEKLLKLRCYILERKTKFQTEVDIGIIEKA